MTGKNELFDVIIIGGSYAGLSSAMTLGRSLRRVLIIDSGRPCNRQTPYSHNFLTQDGKAPAEISSLARQQVSRYGTVQFHEGIAETGTKLDSGFEISTTIGERFRGKKLIFATGVRDLLPEIDGFATCWGISVIHCPYCHGFEVRNEKTGILARGEDAFELGKLIFNWTKNLTILTNGASGLTADQVQKLRINGIRIVENRIAYFEQHGGQIENVVFGDNTRFAVKALYARVAFSQHCDIPQQMGCILTEPGHIQVDPFQQTSVSGVFACGDNSNRMRSVANAVASGTMAGAMANREIIEEEF